MCSRDILLYCDTNFANVQTYQYLQTLAVWSFYEGKYVDMIAGHFSSLLCI